jgi:hypothetical protein
MTEVPTMKIVASEVPPTGTFSSGTGNASATAVTASSAQMPTTVSPLGVDARKCAPATTTTTAPPTVTGRTSGRRRRVSRLSLPSG